MADQMHAFGQAIARDFLDIEIGIGFGKAEVRSIAEPVAVPTLVPAFDQDAAKAVLGGEIDIVLGMLRRRAVIGAAVPRPFVEVHRPPDADIFVGLHPAHIAQLVRLVEVQIDIIVVETSGILGDTDGTPGRGEGAIAHHLGLPAAGRKFGAKTAAVHAAHPHAGIIDQRRLVKRQMRAIGQLERDRRVRGAHGLDRRLVVKIFVSVPVAAANPPGGTGLGDVELGQLLGNFSAPGALGKFVAEAHAIVEQAKAHGQAAILERRIEELET